MDFKPNEQAITDLENVVSVRIQVAVDSVFDGYANRPADEVFIALTDHLQTIGVELPEEVRQTMAEHISAGRRVDTTAG